MSPDNFFQPKFWKDETSGVLAPVIQGYLKGKRLGPNEVKIMRMYLRQWIDSPVWNQNPHMSEDERADLEQLRERAVTIRCQRDITLWLRDAVEFGVDPL